MRRYSPTRLAASSTETVERSVGVVWFMACPRAVLPFRPRPNSLGPHSFFQLGDKVLEPQTSRRLDLADIFEELFFVKSLLSPGQDFGWDPFTREGFRRIGRIG